MTLDSGRFGGTGTAAAARRHVYLFRGNTRVRKRRWMGLMGGESRWMLEDDD